jgi:hypothetical protein
VCFGVANQRGCCGSCCRHRMWQYDHHGCCDVVTPGTCANDFSVVRKWTATDKCGNAKSTSQTITVKDDVGPTIGTIPGPAGPFQCGSELAAFLVPSLTFSDNCDGDGLVTATSADTRATGACVNDFTRTYTWSKTDSCGNQATAKTMAVIVKDTTAPSIGELPTNPGPFQCESNLASYNVPTLSFSDNCEGTGTVTATSARCPWCVCE